jgi:hypothetical protein
MMEIKRDLLVKRIGELRAAVDSRSTALDEARGALAECQAILDFFDRPDQPVAVESVQPVEVIDNPPVEAGGANGDRRGSQETD